MIIKACVILVTAVAPLVAKPPPAPKLSTLPTPQEIDDEVNKRLIILLDGHREGLAVARKLREDLEKLKDGVDHSKRIAELRRNEAELERRIKFLEKMRDERWANPPPITRMPVVPRERPKPKPKVRD